ncbi:MAG: polyhydroxyalkanoate synthesis regulator DNA-binding domain-containing protein [Nannocystaceae bacterium]|nr:hypothetical protein [Myxococcales bacterium]
MIVIKKYGNRRLYDSSTSAYVTLEELAAKLRAGAEVKVIDAKSGRDLTQQTLAQIILEGRGAARLLPTPLLIRLIRLGDDALAEFFGTYVSWALGVYLQVRRGAAAVAGLNPLANLLFQGPLTKLFAHPPWETDAPRSGEPPRDDDGDEPDLAAELATLREELEALKEQLRGRSG